MYAQLCKRLSEEAPNFEGPDSPCTFRRLLLNKCRAEFENRSEAFPDENNLSPEDEERRQIAKRKMLGNIKFIGELGKLEILAEGILHKCVQQLLDRRNRSKDMAEDLECLCQIMRTCGRVLDTEKGQGLMDQYFNRMNVLAKNIELPLRIRFMLRDVIELRSDNWVPRKATNTEGPMPINQICDDDTGRPGIFGSGTGPGAGVVDRSGTGRREAYSHHQELFRRPLKTRGDLDDVLSQGPFGPPPQSHTHQHDKFNSFNTNGYQSGGGGFRQTNRHNQQQQPQFYQQNRYNNNQHSNNSNNNNSSNKDLAPRFKRMLNAHQQGSTNVEEISLRPATNSMLFKTQSKPQIPQRPSLLSEPLLVPLKPNPPIQTKDTSVVLIKQASMEKTKSNRKEKGPSKEEIFKKIISMTEDVLKNGNVDEGMSAFKEHRVPERLIPEALHTVLAHTLDKTDTDRELAVSLVSALKKEGLVTNAQFCECYRSLVNSMADRETTVPKVYSHVAAFGSQAVTDGLMTLSEIAEMVEGGSHYPLFMLTLQNLHKSLGKVELTQLFNNSKVNLLNTLPEADRTKDRLSEILEDRNLTFLFPLLRIQSELWKQVQADPNPTQLYKWVKENLDPAHHTDPGFVNALVTVLIKYITQEVGISEGKAVQEKEKTLLEKFKTVLHPFLHDIDLQVTAVYALQVYCFSLDFPKGMLLRWFINLYDLEIVEEEAFLKWREDVTDAYPGKGKALFQVNTWLTWLAEAESEEEEGDA
ncbi:N-acetyltransferase 1 isoform X2 [Lycorma delicatula]